MKKNNKIAIISFFDYNWSRNYFTLVSSILKNFDREFQLFVGTDKKSIEKYSTIFKNSNILYKDTINLNKYFKNVRTISPRITTAAWYRLKIFDFFNNLEEYRSVIYLDIDTLISKKIPDKYFNSALNYAFLECPNEFSSQKEYFINYWSKKLKDFEKEKQDILSKIENDKYFNSGVLILNNIEKAKILFNRAINSKIMHDDQTLLNLYNKDHILVIDDHKMNNQVSRFFTSSAVIYHFNAKNKPWNYNYKDDKLGKDYLKMVERTRYFEYLKSSNKMLGD